MGDAADESIRLLAPKARALGIHTDEDVFKAHLVRLVLDTNALLAAVIAPGLCRELLRKHLHSNEVTCSPALLGIRQQAPSSLWFEPAEVPLFVAYRQRVHLVVAEPLPSSVCRDPDDDLVLATALAAGAK